MIRQRPAGPHFFISLAMLCLLLSAIGTAISGDGLPSSEPEMVLVLRPSSTDFELAHDGLAATLGDQVMTEKLMIDGDTKVEDVAQAMSHWSPNLVVLMENRTIKLYREWLETRPRDAGPPPPCIALMTLYVEKMIEGMANTVGITYEVPGIASLNHLRWLVAQPIERVGVVYSAGLGDFFARQQALCLAEKIELVGYPLPEAEQKPRKIRRALRTLLRAEAVDALWIFNDSNLLSEDNLARGWVPILLKCNKPILVGVESLITVGHLGVFPDHHSLGEQAAFLVLETRENEWQLTGDRIIPPIGVIKTVNLSRVTPTDIKLNAEVLDEMDHIIQ